MIKLTKEELIFLNNVTKGPAPFGIFLRYPKWRDTEELKEEIVTSLQEKGILDEEKKITQYGMIPLLMWEEYRNAKKHIILNGVYFAMLPGGRITGVREFEGAYYLMTGRGEEILLELLKENEFLRSADRKEEHYTSRQLDYVAWSKRMRDSKPGMVITGSFVDYEPEKEVVYYWNETGGFQYDLNKGRERQLQPRQMRMRLMELLNVQEGGRENE